ncbi:MAG: hypothetical protein Q8R32_00460 [bacterium]|nr:hypothetical protein [bacterium]
MKRYPFVAALLLVAVLFGSAYSSAWAQDTSGWTITVDAAAKQGPSRVKNFLFLQGGPLLAGDEFGSNEASRQFEITAWKALNLSSESLQVFDEGEGSGLLSVVRAPSPPPNAIGPLGPNRDLYLDPKYFSDQRKYFRETFGSDTAFLRVLWVTAMPKVLSSNPTAENYATYPPANYDEWRAVLTAGFRYLNQQGIDDPYVILFGEPEGSASFNTLCPNGETCPPATEPVLREYVRLWAESQRAIQAADPGAKVSAMCASVWGADELRSLRQAPTQRGLDDFIQYVAEYNAALSPGTPPAKLDNICWQGYSWRDEKRLAPMAEHVRSALARYGFDRNTPQYLSGWSGGWASPLGNRYPLLRYASHLIYNVLDQLNPGGAPGPIAQADYYTWNLEDETNKSSLVRTVHRAMPEYASAASTKNCVRPAYVAFQALKAIESGNVLATDETRPALARSIAITADDGIRLLLVNYTSGPQTAKLSINNMPETTRIAEAVLRRVPEKEACGDGNWFPSGNLATLFTNEPAGLTRDASGTATASITLAANAVALLDIPVQTPSAASSQQPAPGKPVKGEGESPVTSTPDQATPAVSGEQPKVKEGISRGAMISVLVALVTVIVAAIAGGAWMVWKKRINARSPLPKKPPADDQGRS